MTRSGLARLLPLLAVLACGGETTEPGGVRGAGSWEPWVLSSGSEIPVAEPTGIGSSAEVAEREEILALQEGLTDSLRQVIRDWDGPPALAWNDLLLDRVNFYWFLLPDVRLSTPVRAARAKALLNIAIHDAAIAVAYHRERFARRAPWRTDNAISRLAADDGLPSYPSEHAAAAGAAAVVMKYLFPDDTPGWYDGLAEEAAESRIVAGVSRRSDVDAGLALGRAVAQRVLAVARLDGSDEVWAGAVPTGPSDWRPTPPRRVQSPYDPLAGDWRTWVISGGGEFRPPAHPAFGSDAFLRDLNELRDLSTSRTPEQADIARYWATETPSTRWITFLDEEIRIRRWAGARTARAYAYLSVAMYDAFVACWDAKYTYWLLRPISADSTLVTVFSTPPFPSYPSGHSTISAAAADVMAELFPDRAAHYRALADEASVSRVYGGVHYRFDVLIGEELGRSVGASVVERMRNDGSEK
ncbi:MAG TPA: phosphatase PAP2 family protein [Gemmatimonadales bacterium]